MPTEERQAEIIAAALTLARERSPAQITTGDIAEAIGLTQGALFRHFPSKEAIWLAAMQWVREELMRRIESAAAAATGPMNALQAVFEAHVDFAASLPGVPRLIFHELQQPADSATKREVRSLLQHYRKLLVHLLVSAADQGEAERELDTDSAATMFIGLIQGLVMQSMLAGRTSGMRQQAEGLFRLFRRSLGTTR